MEQWSFPPAYDDGYFPDPDSRYWFKARETMDPGARERAVLARLREVMAYAYETAPFYRRKWNEAGIHPGHIKSLEDFERVPVVTKAELRQSQADAPPFGDYLCIPQSEVHRIHGTSFWRKHGATFRSNATYMRREDVQNVARIIARVVVPLLSGSSSMQSSGPSAIPAYVPSANTGSRYKYNALQPKPGFGIWGRASPYSVSADISPPISSWVV